MSDPLASGAINWSALITGLISAGSALSIVTGHPALGAVISSPDTAQALTAAIGGITALVTMLMPSAVRST